MSFLEKWQKKQSGNEIDNLKLMAKDKNVIIIGGGDTGCDCIATSLRQVCILWGGVAWQGDKGGSDRSILHVWGQGDGGSGRLIYYRYGDGGSGRLVYYMYGDRVMGAVVGWYTTCMGTVMGQW